MNKASAKILMREAVRDNDWFLIISLILKFGSELLTLYKELRAEKKKELEDKKKDVVKEL